MIVVGWGLGIGWVTASFTGEEEDSKTVGPEMLDSAESAAESAEYSILLPEGGRGVEEGKGSMV